MVNSGGGKNLGDAAAVPDPKSTQPKVVTNRQTPKASLPAAGGKGKAVMSTSYNKNVRWQNKQDEAEDSAREVANRPPCPATL